MTRKTVNNNDSGKFIQIDVATSNGGTGEVSLPEGYYAYALYIWKVNPIGVNDVINVTGPVTFSGASYLKNS